MKTVEYLIVGQGLAGTMLAFEMLDRGMDFRIINSPAKSKASMVAAGMINPLVFKRLTKSWMLDELLPVMENRYHELEKVLSDRFFFQKKILKPLSKQEKTLWKEKQQRPEFAKYIAEINDSPPIVGLTEMPAYGIVENAGYLNLADFLDTAAHYFRSKGLLLDEEWNFSTSETPDSGFRTAGFKARKAILCEGYHLHTNPLFRFVKMNPAKGEVLLVCAPKLSEDYIINKRVFVLPVGKHYFKVGSTYEWEDLSEQPTEDGKQSITDRLNDLITVEYSVADHRAGVRPTVADRRPLLGAHPEHPNLFVFNGLGTKGVMLAPWFAREMCNSLVNKDYILPEEVRISRFWN